jgi:hypothetical protein
LVNVTRKPTSDADDVEKILTMPGKNSAQPVDLEDQKESAVTAGKIRK